MNFSTLAMVLLAWQLLSKPQQQQNPADYLSQFLNDDSKNLMDCVTKLSSKSATQQDKTGAIFQMMTNPAVMDLAQNLFGKKSADQSTPTTNDEGFAFETPSQNAKEFFSPIDNIADMEVKNKLYWFYDNWYVK